MRRPRTPAVLRSPGVGVVIAAMLTTSALAQTTSPATAFDPLAPPPSKPRTTAVPQKPPPYQTFEGRAAASGSDQPTTFAPPPPASGAGATGFDSTNARNRVKPKKPAVGADMKPVAITPPQQIAPGTAAPPPPSPYQRPAVTAAAKDTYAQVGPPGQPPVSLGSPQPPLRKKKKKEETDPYAPLGLRSGGMIYYPAVELITGYDSNPARSSNGSGAAGFTVAPELRMQSDWTRHEFKADLRGSYNWYSPDSTPSLDRPYFNGTADGRIDVFDGTRIDLQGRTLVSTDNPNSPNLQAGLAKLPIYTDVGATAGVGQKFNRLDISVKGLVDRTVYQPSQLTDGSTASNDDRNFNQYGVVLRAGYELLPGITPFIQGGGDQRVHDLPVDFSGFRRDSTGYTAMGGSTFELTRILTGDVAVGYTWRNYEDARLTPLRGLTGVGSLTWTADALTRVTLKASSVVGESDQPGVSGVLSRDVGVVVDHDFRRWLTGTLKGGIGQDQYVGSPRTDNRYYVGAGLTYKLNRFVQVKGEARHEWLTSTLSVNNYAANVFLLGLRLQE